MAIEDIICYGMLALLLMLTVAWSVQNWQLMRDPESQREEKLIRDLNEFMRLSKEAKKYAKLTKKSLDRFFAEVEKQGLNKK